MAGFLLVTCTGYRFVCGHQFPQTFDATVQQAGHGGGRFLKFSADFRQSLALQVMQDDRFALQLRKAG